ncbi:hypothetical protein SADUNF_Sadunf06G0075500 [Salix dunnii]|uniref:Uncharacterized protein n=1 Tax=Salix dunnii TaxID=1413687 RepID=A0A835K337_9ROSI|nr:hypothetical protein SADUNF_Sadunf06G0075500 [Salix dunnii]
MQNRQHKWSGSRCIGSCEYGEQGADEAIGGFRSERVVSSGVTFFLEITWKGPDEYCSGMQTEDQEDPKHAPLDLGRQFFKFVLCCVVRTEDSVVRPLQLY